MGWTGGTHRQFQGTRKTTIDHRHQISPPIAHSLRRQAHSAVQQLGNTGRGCWRAGFLHVRTVPWRRRHVAVRYRLSPARALGPLTARVLVDPPPVEA